MKYAALLKAIQATTTHLQSRVVTAANQALVLRNWVVGAYLVEFEQNGKERATYGERLMESVAADLRGKGTSGFNSTLLRLCRQAYLTYP